MACLSPKSHGRIWSKFMYMCMACAGNVECMHGGALSFHLLFILSSHSQHGTHGIHSIQLLGNLPADAYICIRRREPPKLSSYVNGDNFLLFIDRNISTYQINTSANSYNIFLACIVYIEFLRVFGFRSLGAPEGLFRPGSRLRSTFRIGNSYYFTPRDLEELFMEASVWKREYAGFFPATTGPRYIGTIGTALV